MVTRKQRNLAIAKVLREEIADQGDYPIITFRFALVPNGYVLDLKINGKPVITESCDFGGTRDLSALSADLINHLLNMSKTWREKQG